MTQHLNHREFLVERPPALGVLEYTLSQIIGFTLFAIYTLYAVGCNRVLLAHEHTRQEEDMLRIVATCEEQYNGYPSRIEQGPEHEYKVLCKRRGAIPSRTSEHLERGRR